MSPLELFFTVIAITASGALAPGPMFFSTILEGTRHGIKAGLIFSITHALVELPLVISLALGFVSFSQPAVKVVVGILGGFVLLFLGLNQARGAFRPLSPTIEQTRSKHASLFVTGLALNALNPFFLIWWLTIGAKLILDSLEYSSYAGVLLTFFFHIWIDFVWLSFLAYSAAKGRDLIGSKGYRLLLGSFGIILMMYGLNFLYTAIVG
ncbi:MAG: LysE family transporter [Thermoproteota archaeon]